MSNAQLERPHVDCCSCAHWLRWECVDCNRKSGGTSERYEARIRSGLDGRDWAPAAATSSDPISDGHSWAKHEREGWTVCARCGLVRNYDRPPATCRGAAQIALREARGPIMKPATGDELTRLRLELDTARTGRAAWEQLYNERNRALMAIQDKRERALVELSRNGCDCECDCVVNQEDHNEDCEPCLACRIAAILEDQS